MTEPIDVPQAPAAVPTVDEVVVETPAKFVRTKKFAKTTFVKIGVPVLVGATAAILISRKSSKESYDTDDNTETDTTNE